MTMADYYGNAADFVAYCAARAYPLDGLASPSPSEDIDAALLVASEYIDNVYRSRFSGTKAAGRSQEREWPRADATDAAGEEIDYTEVPVEIERATYEAAFRHLENPGSLMPDYVAAERVSSERVGSLAVTYATSVNLKASDAWPIIGTIEGILAPLIGALTPTSLFGEATRI
jgi:hypothetical protein